jgi:mannose-6-phosphate isomerase-like protein (cupin superfamily)
MERQRKTTSDESVRGTLQEQLRKTEKAYVKFDAQKQDDPAGAPPRLPPVGLLPERADSGSRYQVKRICLNPGARLSLQKHFHRSEHWVVVHGVAEVTIGEDVRLYHENESVYVPIGAVHRLANPGKIPLELIEVQVGSYLGEDDILRLGDVYRRPAAG